MDGQPLQVVSEHQDLGIIVDSSLKLHSQATSAINKANRVLGLIKISFNTLNRNSPILYKALVRPHLEYANVVWGPNYIGDGCEAAVHATQSLFHSSNTQAVLLADASNAFNSLNRHVTLHNLHFICPPLAVTITNVYREASSLFIDNECLLSEEGTTQGDPLAMAMYALSTVPLIRKLDGLTTQVWFADDAAAA